MQLDVGMSYALISGMNANPVSSLAAIFVVFLSSGQYSDHSSTPIKAFATRTEADRFCTSKEANCRRLEGMQDAINGMHAEWQKVNPAPSYNYDSGNSDQTAAYDAWHASNAAELDRLYTITGFLEAVKDAGLSQHHDVSYTCYYVTEVPFTS
jgi:hypothetical protein